MKVEIGKERNQQVTRKILGNTFALLLALLCLSVSGEEQGSSTEIEKCIRNSEFVAHGLVDTFGTGMDGSLVRIGFHVRAMLKGNYTETKVEFEELPPEVSGGAKAFDLFKEHGHDYIICFKKGAEAGQYQYCGPSFNSPGIIANFANLQKAKEIIGGAVATSSFAVSVSIWWLSGIAAALLALAVILTIRQILRKRHGKTKV